MIFIVDLIIIFLSLIYLVVSIWLFRGIKKIRSQNDHITSDNSFPLVSIVIAARNEEKNIIQCLDKCIHQDYPLNKFEIIAVNDRSEDNTGKILENIAEQVENVRIINIQNLPDEYAKSGKKHALKQGIENSKGEIILLTDADCLPKPGWIKGIIKYFSEDVGVVVGHSPIQGEGFINRLIQLDNLSFIAVGAGGIGGGYPILSVGRNFAYRRKVFDEIDGFERIKNFTSGDDDLVIMLVREHTTWKINFASDPESFVFTFPPKNIKDAFKQRMRWASKGLHYSFLMTLILIIVFLYNFVLFVSLPFFFAGLIKSTLPLISFILKLIIDFFIIYPAARLLKESEVIKFYPVAMLLHIPYLIFFSLYGTFGKVQWKSPENNK